MSCYEKLCWMKDTLICEVENQLLNISEVDTEELGDAIDMIKDIEEAIYYCTVTEAMKNPAHEQEWKMKKGDHYEDYNDRMYYDGKRYPTTHHEEKSYDEPDMRDAREGRSYKTRRMYMEAKDMNRDKATQLRELEKYMQELSQDITEMIADASPEEKQYLEKKITALASKIGQMK